MDSVTLIECPRDAWQGLPRVIPADVKAAYHRALIAAGFRYIDAVSFVSPKYVPQMADSEQVMHLLQSDSALVTCHSQLEIIGIVVNEVGMERALKAPGVTTLGYPYSISAHFRQANARMTRAESRGLVERLRAATKAASRQLVVYISMAFGNNYGEPWGPEIIEDTLTWLKDIGVRTVSLADTIGTASPELVGSVFSEVKNCVAGIELGLHLHSRPDGAAEKVLAAYESGCRRFDSALTGLGGCPFAGDDLVGNIPTEIVVHTLAQKGADSGLSEQTLEPVLALTHEIRSKYAH
jgi:hydroxymethylglutaryl-CoA lyase